MNRKITNDKASRSLTAILAGADEEETVETVVDTETGSEDEVEPEEVEDEEGSEDEVEDEVEEITEEEVEAARKAAEDEVEPEEVEDEEGSEDEVEDEEPVEITDDEDEEPEELEEITEEEVEAARKEMEGVEEEEVEEVEEDGSEDGSEEISVEEAMDEEPEEDIDEEATSEAVACLVKKGFTCSIDGLGKISVTACGEQCDDEETEEVVEEKSIVELNPVDSETKVEACDVCCVLNGEGSEKPFYTILIKGMPVATICLEDQQNAESIRNYFLSNEYPRKLASAMASGGVKDVLDTLNARMFAAAASKSDMAQAMKAEAKAEFEKQIAEAVVAAKDKFVSAVKLAVAGMNKNFFQEDNNLKAATYAAFTELGCNADVAYDKVNKVFAEADSFFDTAIAKAQELMGKSDEAFAEVSEMVANAGIASKPAKTFASALSEGNNPIIAGAQTSVAHKATASTESKIKAMRLFR